MDIVVAKFERFDPTHNPTRFYQVLFAALAVAAIVTAVSHLVGNLTRLSPVIRAEQSHSDRTADLLAQIDLQTSLLREENLQKQ